MSPAPLTRGCKDPVALINALEENTMNLLSGTSW